MASSTLAGSTGRRQLVYPRRAWLCAAGDGLVEIALAAVTAGSAAAGLVDSAGHTPAPLATFLGLTALGLALLFWGKQHLTMPRMIWAGLCRLNPPRCRWLSIPGIVAGLWVCFSPALIGLSLNRLSLFVLGLTVLLLSLQFAAAFVADALIIAAAVALAGIVRSSWPLALSAVAIAAIGVLRLYRFTRRWPVATSRPLPAVKNVPVAAGTGEPVLEWPTAGAANQA